VYTETSPLGKLSKTWTLPAGETMFETVIQWLYEAEIKLMKPKKSAECHQTLFTGLEWGLEMRLRVQYLLLLQ